MKLREKRPSADAESEPTRVITVRLPKSMHESLRTEAHDLRTSMNKLCISKLLQVIGEEMIPNERASGGTTSTGSTASSGSTSGSLGTAQPAVDASSPEPPADLVGSPFSQQHQPTPPFKSAQPRF